MVPVSAKAGTGIDALLDTVLLEADIKELKANKNRRATGVVIEFNSRAAGVPSRRYWCRTAHCASATSLSSAARLVRCAR